MKEFMKIKDYCEESGFPEYTLRNLCGSYLSYRFSHRTGDSKNSHYIIDVPTFESMWRRGEFRNI